MLTDRKDIIEQDLFSKNSLNVIDQQKVVNKIDKFVNNVKQVNTATSHITQKGIGVRMRCAIYIRVSTDKEEQKASLKYQQELFSP